MSSIGVSVWSSQATNARSTTAATPNATSVVPEPHPWEGASMRPYTSETIPMIERTAPIGSTSASSGSRDFGSRNHPAPSATAMIGTFTRNTDPYQNRDSNTPVETGPMAPAAPTTPAQMAIAFVRSSGGNTFTRIDSVDGMMNAAPNPIAARAAMSSPIECDDAA